MSDLVIPPGYGRVVGRVLRAVTVETGPAPLVGARVTVRPSVARVTRDGDPTPLIMGDAIECTLDDNGFLLGPDGEPGVLLVATDADTRPAGWHWVVRVSAPSVASYQWQVLVPEGVTTDMVAATSDPSTSGLPILEWRGILAEVWDAHSDVMSAVGAVDQDRQLVMAARAGAEQAAGSAETASSQAVAAQGSAEDAADTAETARNQAVTARDDAVTASDQAVTAKEQAEGFAAASGTYATQAETSAQAAEGFAGDAETALTRTLAAAVYELRGTGQPGSTTETNNAPPGTYYTDTAGTAGAWRWLKTSTGSGVARWVVVHGDTGWRNVSAYLVNGWSGTVLIRRVGQTINVEVNDLYATTATSPVFYTAPVGFRSRNSGRRMLYLLVPSGQWCRSDWSSSNITVEGYAGDWRVRGSLAAFTNDPWPTTLPGTPA